MKNACLKEFEENKIEEIDKQTIADGKVNAGEQIMSMNNDARNALFYTILKSTGSGKGCIPKENFFQGNNGDIAY